MDRVFNIIARVLFDRVFLKYGQAWLYFSKLIKFFENQNLLLFQYKIYSENWSKSYKIEISEHSYNIRTANIQKSSVIVKSM